MTSMSHIDIGKSTDRFGNPIDPSVNYARGKILASSLDEASRMEHAFHLIQERAKEKGVDAFFNFTGLHRDYAVAPEHLAFAEEWVGPALFWDDLVRRARAHLGGNAQHRVALFNRASAGIVATMLALAEPATTVISVCPGNGPHPSIRKGVELSRADLFHADSLEAVDECLSSRQVRLIVLTGVSSELGVIDAEMLRCVIERGKSRNIPTFLDDAYGARLRPIVYRQPKSLETGADLVITSCDKAGFGGPRAGLMAGSPAMVDRVAARASELGMEARPPLALGVYESLVHFDPERLWNEVRFGESIFKELSTRYGPDRVLKTGLGATIAEEDALEIVQRHRTSHTPLPFVPAEITAAIGMFWLYRFGIITVNAMGQPGARVSLRFKPDPVEIERFGGIGKMMDVVEEGFEEVAKKAASAEEMKQLILG